MKVVTSLIEAHIVRIIDKKVEFLLLKRSPEKKYPNIWQMVTGKIKANEKAYETAIREIKEETNLDIDELFIVPNINNFYNEIEDSITQIPVFVATVKDETKFKLSNEHVKFKWVSYKKSQKMLAWPGQKKSEKIIKDYFEKKYETLNFIKVK
ncbi:MAG: NUDIX domain-containing protein [Ignavibacteriales bacterium]|nr:NUDIX domain-containing protein [Ignavibacteriales bacterium]MBK7979054.1 NUDIX domain-containing protein [Ignavibacteriota bacterium]